MYTLKSRVRYSEVDYEKKLDAYNILKYMQDCSIQHSEDIGRGFEYLEKNKRVWLMVGWQLCINHFPKVCENIEVNTWATSFNTMLGYRNFTLTDSNGIAAYANSIWVYYDSENNRPAKVLPENVEGYTIEPPFEMEYLPRKIEVPSELITLDPITVIPSNLDNNMHVNNCEYVRMAKQLLPHDFTIRMLRADYRRSALLGETIIPKLNKSGDDLYTIVLEDTKNKPYVIVELKGSL